MVKLIAILLALYLSLFTTYFSDAMNGTDNEVIYDIDDAIELPPAADHGTAQGNIPADTDIPIVTEQPDTGAPGGESTPAASPGTDETAPGTVPADKPEPTAPSDNPAQTQPGEDPSVRPEENEADMMTDF